MSGLYENINEYQEVVLTNNLDLSGTGTNTAFSNGVSATALDVRVTHMALTSIAFVPRISKEGLFPMNVSDISFVSSTGFTFSTLIYASDKKIGYPEYSTAGLLGPSTNFNTPPGSISFPWGTTTTIYDENQLQQVITPKTTLLQNLILAQSSFGDFKFTTPSSEYQNKFWKDPSLQEAYVRYGSLSGLVVGRENHLPHVPDSWEYISAQAVWTGDESTTTFENSYPYNAAPFTTIVKECYSLIYTDPTTAEKTTLVTYDMNMNSSSVVGNAVFSEQTVPTFFTWVESETGSVIDLTASYSNMVNSGKMTLSPPKYPFLNRPKRSSQPRPSFLSLRGHPYTKPETPSFYKLKASGGHPNPSPIMQILCTNLELSYLAAGQTVHVLKTMLLNQNELPNANNAVSISVSQGQLEWKPVQATNFNSINIILADGSGREHKLLSNLDVDVYLKIKFRNTPARTEMGPYV